MASPDALDFQVNKDVKFNGVTLYGSVTANDTHSVRVQLYEGTTRLCDYTQTITSDGSATPIAVPIPTAPVIVKPGTRYTVKVGRTGTFILHGQEAAESVTTAGCTFSYYAHHAANNGTNVTRGQIPHILFSKSH